MTLTQEYLDGIEEGRAWLRQHGLSDASAHLANLETTGGGNMTIDENYDLRAACQENNVKHDDIDAVLLELTGENDKQGWHWLVSLIGGGFAYISGWCDYTGWDCQSGAERFDAESLEYALALCPQDVRRVFEDMRTKNETVRPNTGGL